MNTKKKFLPKVLVIFEDVNYYYLVPVMHSSESDFFFVSDKKSYRVNKSSCALLLEPYVFYDWEYIKTNKKGG